jgi:hypothetical protein
MFKGRNTRDLETLAGRRGNTGQRAVLWDEIDQITRRVAQSFTDGGVSTGGGSAGAIDESALEDYIANTSPSVQQINQTIDSTTTFIGNLTADARATLPDLDQAITDARNDALDAVNVAQGEIDTLTGAYTGTLPDLEAAITAARNDATAQIDTAETGLQSQINGVSADLTNNYYTIVQSDSAISSAVTTLESSLLTEINNIIAAGDGSETVQTLSARLDADFFTKTETNTAISAATTSLEASLQTDISEVAETLPNFDFSQGITGWRGKAIDQGSYSIVTGPEFIGGQAFRQVGVLNSTNFLASVDSRKTVIDTARAYRVKARFRVVGTVPSKIFFSIRFEDVNGNYISDYFPAGFGPGVNKTPVQNNGAWVSVSIMSGIGTDNPFPAGAFKAYPLISLGNQQGPDSIVELDELALLEVTDSREVAATLEQNYLTIAETDQAISTATTALQSSLESQIGTLNATLTEDYFTSADTTQAISAAQATLQSNIDTVSANLTSEQATRANADSALTTSLNTLTTRVGSAEAEIAGEQIARSDADNALAVDISTLTTRVGDAESDITSEQTARTDADSAIAIDLSALTTRVDTAESSIISESIVSSNADDALASDITALTTRVDGAEADITSEQSARASADSALATDITSLTTRVGSAEAEIAGEQIARSDADNALAVDISTLTTRVGDAESDITSEQTARTDADSAIAIDLSALTTRVDTAESSIISESIVSSNADDALASDITALTTRVDGAEADITSEQSARASADSALATDITSLTTRVGSAEAEIAGEQIARSNADSALASDISTVSANLATTDASVTQTANAVATIESFAGATYTLRALAGAAEGVLELVAADDPINGPNSALRIDVTQVNIEGRLNADWITGGFMRANQMKIDDLLFLDSGSAGFSIDKTSAYDVNSDGIYMGRTNELDGSIGFGLAFSKTDDITGLRQSIEATRRNGVRLFNANHYRTLSVPLNPLLYTDPQTVDLTGYSRVDILLVGGGAGGNAGDLDGQGTAGGDTVVVLKDGATVIETWTAVGGQPEVESVRNRAPATRGESSPWGTGGAAGANLSYETYDRPAGGEGDTRLATRPVDETSGGNATGYGAGGGGGGASQPQDGGGLGGQSSPLVSIVGYDISGMSAPTLEITDIGAAGLGASGSASGGGGSPGRVQVAENNSEDIPADVIPLLATQKGSASSHGPFPDYGAGFWVFHTLDGTSLNMGKIELDESGGEVIATTSDYISLVSAKTPDVIIPAGISKTIRFLFFKMGP